MIQSESRTWPAFVAGEKNVTRRFWKDSTAAWYKAGKVFDAYDNAPFRGGRLIGKAKVLEDAYREPLKDCPIDDYYGEGFDFLRRHPFLIPKQARAEVWAQDNCSFASFVRWCQFDVEVWVVRFEIVEIEDSAVKLLESMLSGERVA